MCGGVGEVGWGGGRGGMGEVSVERGGHSKKRKLPPFSSSVSDEGKQWKQGFTHIHSMNCHMISYNTDIYIYIDYLQCFGSKERDREEKRMGINKCMLQLASYLIKRQM